MRSYEAKLTFGDSASGTGWEHVAQQMSGRYKILDIWTLFRINLPLADELHDNFERRIIRAQSKKKGGISDIVFVDLHPDSQDVQIGIQGISDLMISNKPEP